MEISQEGIKVVTALIQTMAVMGILFALWDIKKILTDQLLEMMNEDGVYTDPDQATTTKRKEAK